MVLAVLVIHVHQLVSVQAIERQDDHQDEIRDQQRQIKCIRFVQPLERLVEKMGTNIMSESAWRGDSQGTYCVGKECVQAGTPVKKQSRTILTDKPLVQEELAIEGVAARRAESGIPDHVA